MLVAKPGQLALMFPSLVLPILLQLAPATTPSEAPPRRVLRLEDALSTALSNQPTLRQAHAQTTAAQGRATQARQLYYPQVTATASYQRVRGATIGGRTATTTTTPTTTPTTGVSSIPTTLATANSNGIDIFTFGGSASQLIWDFGTTYNKAHAADRLVDAFVANEKVSGQTVVLDVRRSYFTTRAQKALIGVARQSLDNFRSHLTQVEGFVKVGTRPEIDLAQARTDVSNARLSLITSENAYAVAKAQLGRAMGQLDSADFDVADDALVAVDGEELDTDRLLARAITTRPELAVYDKQRESYTLSAKSYRGAYGPTLSAGAGASETGTELGSLGPAWNVGLTAAWPLFQGWLTHGQVREAEANADAARAQLDGQKLQIRVDIQQAQLGIRAAKASQRASDEALVNAKERLRLADGRYASGVGSAIELGDAQLALATASAQVVQAEFNLSSARADLLSALGQR